MDAPSRRAGSTARVLVTHGVLILIPVILLGVGLSLGIRATTQSRGFVEARSEALLVAQTAVVPLLNDRRPLSEGMTRREVDAMDRLVGTAVTTGHLLLVRVRDEHGNVVFRSDGSSTSAETGQESDDGTDTDGEVIAALDGHTMTRMTHLNTDAGDTGPVGPAAVEVYQPLTDNDGARVGVLEMYLPYVPIEADVNASLRVLYRDLGLGLAGLFVVLVAITLSVSRGLRRELAASAWRARHDALTGLPNRALFMEEVAEAAARAGRTGEQAVVAVMDLDNFKDLNDTLGHSSGDKLLIEVGRRLDTNVGRPGTVARLGGDEYGLVLHDPAEASAQLARLAAVVATEVEVAGLPLTVAPSIGHVRVTDAETTAETLMQRAEVAMYAAKAGHTVVAEYDTDLEHFVAADMELIAEVPHGLTGGQFTLHYQPQIDATSRDIVAAEALIRWRHPQHGLLLPGRFLPMAEQTDLIERLTDWVLATALADAGRLAARGSPIPIAVNVSARSVVRDDFAQHVIDALDAAGVPPSRLVIEVTETALLTNPERARVVLSKLDRAGVHVSIDDFGQGQTSLGYLANLPIRELKIDRGFVTGMTDDHAKRAIAHSVIELGHNLGMRVVAEGIETGADLAAVRRLGCDLAQGYYIGRPMEFDALVDRLAGLRAGSGAH